jgi:LacI family transcriptional regulator
MVNTTLKKISEILGVSISTVSRALKDHPDISTETKRKIVELAQALDYEPNINAINLRTRNSKVLGLMVPSLANSFYDSFMSAVEAASMKIGYALVIMQSGDDPEVERNILKIYKQNRVSGIFACLSPHTADIEAFQKLKDLDIPVIFFDKVPQEDNCHKVCIADESASEQAARVLIAKKKKNVLAIFGNKNLSITKSRLEAFLQTLSNHSDIKLTIGHAHSSQEAHDITSAFFSEPQKPDAVFCMSDEILTGAMKAFQELKINYPEETGIIAMSDGYFPKLYHPEITYIETSGYKLGDLAFSMMMTCLNGNNNFNQKLSIDAALVEGGSI